MPTFSQRILSFILFIGVCLLSMGWNPALAWSAPVIPHPEALAQAVQDIESLDALRAGLASSLDGSAEVPTLQTMKEVCRPVGLRAIQLSQDNGWQVKQIAKKYRNPDHAPVTLREQMALAKFNQQPDLIGFWDQETLDKEMGTRYYRRIDVEGSCLACHGLKERRPQFVKDGYPQDLAYNFNVGDLRGMYAVFIPDNIQKSVKNSAD
ncbi:MAG: DUF3365 domain-containing protein [Cyanobacteriota bacterium]|jgi:hypothetical protein